MTFSGSDNGRQVKSDEYYYYAGGLWRYASRLKCLGNMGRYPLRRVASPS
jgi:hypothetical protein